MTQVTIRAAVEFFADFSGQVLDEDDIQSAISEIGNPDSTLPVTKTAETVADFINSGWSDFRNGKFNAAGIVTLTKGFSTATIADLGDYRLAYVSA
jgi:hypothetical protein